MDPIEREGNWEEQKKNNEIERYSLNIKNINENKVV